MKTPLQIKKHSKGLCENKHCRNKHTKHRWKCHSCLNDEYKARNPVKNAYRVLKNNAKRRRKEFHLTFEQFEQFAVKTTYMDNRGKTHFGLHIDRINESLGYSIDNIQAITNSENVKKYHRLKLKNCENVPF